MDRKVVLTYGALAIVAALLILLMISIYDVNESPSPEEARRETIDPRSPDFWNPDSIPDPMNDLETREQVQNLWPDVFEPGPDREAVRRQWQEFARDYPDNIYIPSQYLPELSESEINERRQVLDAVGDVHTEIANRRARARKEGEPGTPGPDAPAESPVSPETQRRYFQYRIRELQSRIELVEYALARDQLDPDQIPAAEAELEDWRREMAELEAVAAEIPAE
ncbi:MAG: hypothetical protein KDK30_17655 [Leptospiraceae bacterium]|nr:hypothetical protein [Leptospiraceae bacterium]